MVYESGSDGEWWTGHELERNVIAGVVNVPVLSFRFTRDFLAFSQGALPSDLVRRLGGPGRQQYADEKATILGVHFRHGPNGGVR